MKNETKKIFTKLQDKIYSNNYVNIHIQILDYLEIVKRIML